MLHLAETQAAFRAAITGADHPEHLRLVAPAAIADRLAIYQRHHRESFRRHLRGRFPTVEWLIGTSRMLRLADETLRRSPPRAPSLAEYGAELVEMLAATADDWPAYLPDVARLDWELGRVSVAITHAPLPVAALAAVHPDQLADLRLRLQPGSRFLSSRWPVDALVHLHLGGTEQQSFVLEDQPVWLQLNGSRGQFTISRIDAPAFLFRAAIASGAPLGIAAERAISHDPTFDISRALATLFAENLVTTLIPELIND